MSLNEISKATRIQVKYLEYIENGQYEKLPADVYVRGFLRSYARYLNMDEQAFIKLYERERNIQTNLGRDVSKKTFNVKNLDISSFVVTPRSLTIAIIFLLVGGAFIYLYQEFQSFAGVPRLVILSPANGATIEEDEVVVRGKTDKDARVSINNQSVFVGGDGEFSDKLILQPGLNTVTVVAINRFDKEKSETFSVDAHYTPAAATISPEEASATDRTEAFHLDVSVAGVPVKVTLTADGEVVFSGILKPETVQAVEAKETIKIVSENAAQTFVRFNGAKEEVLGGEQKPPAEFIFTTSGKQGSAPL